MKQNIFYPKETLLYLKEAVLHLKESILELKEVFLYVKEIFLKDARTVCMLFEQGNRIKISLSLGYGYTRLFF